MDKVRIGIIGIGGMGSNHAGYISRGARRDRTRPAGIYEPMRAWPAGCISIGYRLTVASRWGN